MVVKRKRGSAGQKQRARRLLLHPVCAHCKANGIVKATDIIDHIIPLAFGGSDDDINTQGLCSMHDAIKTTAEAANQHSAANHPKWLKRSSIPLWIVTGPPCSGKSSLVSERARRGDIVIDLDDIAESIVKDWDRQWNDDLLNRSIRVRNAMLGNLSKETKGKAAWFIVGAPSIDERRWWRGKLGGVVISLDVPRDICIERATKLGRSIKAIDNYFKAASRPWLSQTNRLVKRGIDGEGYPI